MFQLGCGDACAGPCAALRSQDLVARGDHGDALTEEERRKEVLHLAASQLDQLDRAEQAWRRAAELAPGDARDDRRDSAGERREELGLATRLRHAVHAFVGGEEHEVIAHRQAMRRPLEVRDERSGRPLSPATVLRGVNRALVEAVAAQDAVPGAASRR